MDKKDIKVGDVLIVREWEDMEREFGRDRRGNIPCYCTFVKEMREFCGQTCIVKSINSERDNKCIIRLEERTFDGYNISSDMVESVHITEIDEITESDIENILTQRGII